ncbi:mitochondrial import inner membrane translocase subunit Tim10 isoform X1 [Polypterus senegalus]|uniref:mitochondrial import inner membrane translocase subunit Tim10 isoform X1 n=1 Tax=Polypterus senegalus TaxID=55291 RepID=UPI001965991C|nr:mitochondrial import inner membrane translocase subunit Tim10 isoform X1 [Polypterus senegalus]
MPTSKLIYHYPSGFKTVFQYLAWQQHNNILCDVLLQAEGFAISAHSCVLSACSKILMESLTYVTPECMGQRILLEIQGISFTTLSLLVSFMYTFTLQLSCEEEARIVLLAGRALQIQGLCNATLEKGKIVWQQDIHTALHSETAEEQSINVITAAISPLRKKTTNSHKVACSLSNVAGDPQPSTASDAAITEPADAMIMTHEDDVEACSSISKLTMVVPSAYNVPSDDSSHIGMLLDSNSAPEKLQTLNTPEELLDQLRQHSETLAPSESRPPHQKADSVTNQKELGSGRTEPSKQLEVLHLDSGKMTRNLCNQTIDTAERVSSGSHLDLENTVLSQQSLSSGMSNTITVHSENQQCSLQTVSHITTTPLSSFDGQHASEEQETLGSSCVTALGNNTCRISRNIPAHVSIRQCSVDIVPCVNASAVKKICNKMSEARTELEINVTNPIVTLKSKEKESCGCYEMKKVGKTNDTIADRTCMEKNKTKIPLKRGRGRPRGTGKGLIRIEFMKEGEYFRATDEEEQSNKMPRGNTEPCLNPECLKRKFKERHYKTKTVGETNNMIEDRTFKKSNKTNIPLRRGRGRPRGSGNGLKKLEFMREVKNFRATNEEEQSNKIPRGNSESCLNPESLKRKFKEGHYTMKAVGETNDMIEDRTFKKNNKIIIPLRRGRGRPRGSGNGLKRLEFMREGKSFRATNEEEESNKIPRGNTESCLNPEPQRIGGALQSRRGTPQDPTVLGTSGVSSVRGRKKAKWDEIVSGCGSFPLGFVRNIKTRRKISARNHTSTTKIRLKKKPMTGDSCWEIIHPSASSSHFATLEAQMGGSLSPPHCSSWTGGPVNSVLETEAAVKGLQNSGLKDQDKTNGDEEESAEFIENFLEDMLMQLNFLEPIMSPVCVKTPEIFEDLNSNGRNPQKTSSVCAEERHSGDFNDVGASRTIAPNYAKTSLPNIDARRVEDHKDSRNCGKVLLDHGNEIESSSVKDIEEGLGSTVSLTEDSHAITGTVIPVLDTGIIDTAQWKVNDAENIGFVEYGTVCCPSSLPEDPQSENHVEVERSPQSSTCHIQVIQQPTSLNQKRNASASPLQETECRQDEEAMDIRSVLEQILSSMSRSLQREYGNDVDCPDNDATCLNKADVNRIEQPPALERGSFPGNDKLEEVNCAGPHAADHFTQSNPDYNSLSLEVKAKTSKVAERCHSVQTANIPSKSGLEMKSNTLAETDVESRDVLLHSDLSRECQCFVGQECLKTFVLKQKSSCSQQIQVVASSEDSSSKSTTARCPEFLPEAVSIAKHCDGLQNEVTCVDCLSNEAAEVEDSCLNEKLEMGDALPRKVTEHEDIVEGKQKDRDTLDKSPIHSSHPRPGCTSPEQKKAQFLQEDGNVLPTNLLNYQTGSDFQSKESKTTFGKPEIHTKCNVAKWPDKRALCGKRTRVHLPQEVNSVPTKYLRRGEFFCQHARASDVWFTACSDQHCVKGHLNTIELVLQPEWGHLDATENSMINHAGEGTESEEGEVDILGIEEDTIPGISRVGLVGLNSNQDGSSSGNESEEIDVTG